MLKSINGSRLALPLFLTLSVLAASCQNSFYAKPSVAGPKSQGAATTTAPAASALTVEGDKVYLAGLEEVTWGGMSQQQNSMIAATAAALRLIGRDVKYEQLMGLSGAAFRIQFYMDEGCPSSPHACCGFNCFEVATKALGIEVVPHDVKKDDAESWEKARMAAVESINRGCPALLASEECGLVVGYVKGGKELLCRPYSPRDKGYVVVQQPPWCVGVIRMGAAPAPRENVVRSLKVAIEVAYAEKFDKYASGFAAYEAWISHLENDRRFERYTKEDLSRITLANGFTYGCLSLDRLWAARYLPTVADQFKGPARQHVEAAAELYKQIADTLGRKHGDIACPWSLMPWEFRDGKTWTSAMRHTQANVLKECLALERRAILELQQAMETEPKR